jgi:hypothetical protein
MKKRPVDSPAKAGPLFCGWTRSFDITLDNLLVLRRLFSRNLRRFSDYNLRLFVVLFYFPGNGDCDSIQLLEIWELFSGALGDKGSKRVIWMFPAQIEEDAAILRLISTLHPSCYIGFFADMSPRFNRYVVWQGFGSCADGAQNNEETEEVSRLHAVKIG